MAHFVYDAWFDGDELAGIVERNHRHSGAAWLADVGVQ